MVNQPLTKNANEDTPKNERGERKKPQIPTPKNRYAFLIACQDYLHEKPLETPVNGSRALEQLLGQQYGFRVESIVNPTRAKLADFLGSIPEKITERESQVIIYYGGHGHMTEDEHGMQGFFVPVDGKFNDRDSVFPFSELADKLTDSLPEDYCRHLLIGLDCCYSGAYKTTYTNRRMRAMGRTDITKQKYRLFERNTSWQTLVASTETQEVYDSFALDPNFSPFTYFFLNGLKGDADTDKNKLIRATELFSYIQDRNAYYYAGKKSAPVPGFIPMKKHSNGDFLFYLRDFDVEDLPNLEFFNPYKGLASYESGDSKIFFGRDDAIKKLTEFIDSHELTVVIGSSGSGKSSLVKAGAIPIQETKMGKKDIYVFKPKMNEKFLLPKEKYDIIVIDQYEELFDIKISPDDRIQFVHTFLNHMSYGCKVIITLRNDFEKIAQRDFQRALGSYLSAALDEEERKRLESLWQQFQVSAFSLDEIFEVISGPTSLFAFDFKPLNLREEIASEVMNFQHSIPMLSFAMEEMCETCRGAIDDYRVITWQVYDKMEKVQGALKTKADGVYEDVKKVGLEDTMRNILLRMVTYNEDRIMKQAVYDSELNLHGHEPENIKKVLDEYLIPNRLVVTGTRKTLVQDFSQNGSAGPARVERESVYYEPTHDAIIESWGQMRTWLDQATQENIEFVNKLSTDTETYFNQNRNPKNLWFGDNLKKAIEYKKELIAPIALNKEELEFIRASEGKENRRLAEKRVVRVGILATIVCIILAVVVVAVIHEIESKKSAYQKMLARESKIQSQIDSLGVEILNINPAISNVKGLRKLEQYDGALMNLDNIDSTLFANRMMSVQYRLYQLQLDTFVQRRQNLAAAIAQNLDKASSMKEVIKMERDTCRTYKRLWDRYTALRQAGDDLRNQGDERLLDAYKKYLQARNVDYPPKAAEIRTIIRETGNNLERVYTKFMEAGYVRLKAKNKTAAYEAYSYAREIAVAIGISTVSVDKAIQDMKAKKTLSPRTSQPANINKGNPGAKKTRS